MAAKKGDELAAARKQKLAEATDVLERLGFGPRQRNEGACYTLLACLELFPKDSWNQAKAPLRGITPIIEFIHEAYGVRYAPNTRETIRDEAVKHFVESGLLVRNPDNPDRPTNSGKTVYQIEQQALELLRRFGSPEWTENVIQYLHRKQHLVQELERNRNRARIAARLPNGTTVSLSPGGQNPLIKTVLEEFCPEWLPGGIVLYIGDTENKFLHLNVAYLEQLGVVLKSAEKMPDLIVHDPARNWLVLIEAVTTAGPVDGKRRLELKKLFHGSTAGLVFVTAFASRQAMRAFLPQISWETKVWVADAPKHLIHFNGDRCLGPYPDVLPVLK